ncbi:MAG TPA: hypothetical protein VJ998_04950 [Pseudomonadales bacterium]|nr:hypothetical protein [Pseudomonadales bacterium]
MATDPVWSVGAQLGNVSARYVHRFEIQNKLANSRIDLVQTVASMFCQVPRLLPGAATRLVDLDQVGNLPAEIKLDS